ncbi:ABC transporter, permease protein [Aeropyrum pernix K1]|uniref:ABC transporter, permease protein n=1 Tax=Aeropyrum pernix (strain ATCC 700893 / DSM 11879 / JCM 9820 / NBRC 100138 / K1) TaxID=272557 RepID=Q9YG63_AERPE|nr:sugar ABC transporter permease [Aeropyrum pernix]BAA78947.2 ABC transporter, permease protein [Aeropyrum pernix K1]
MAGPPRGYFKALVFLLPAFTFITIFVIAPSIATVYLSLNVDGHINLEKYAEVVSERSPDKALIMITSRPESPPWGALIHNIIWMALHIPLVTFLGLFLAYLLKYTFGSSIVKTIVFIGMVIPMVVGGLIVRFMFDEYVGVVPLVFKALGVDFLAKTWTNYPQLSLLSLILGSVWLWTGFSLTVYSAALGSIPSSFIEAARIDGAGHWHIFWKIVFPLVRPATIIVVVMTMLWDLKIFDIVYVATLGGPGGSSNVLALVMYQYMARALDYQAASAVAVILTLLTLPPGLWLALRLRRGG